MVKWVNAEERLPKNQEHEPCNTYHVVKFEWENGALSLAIAMYMDGVCVCVRRCL